MPALRQAGGLAEIVRAGLREKALSRLAAGEFSLLPSARPADSRLSRLLPHSLGVYRLLGWVPIPARPVCEGLRLGAPPSSSREKRIYPLAIKRPASSQPSPILRIL